MHRKIIVGNGKTVVQAAFDDGSKKVLTYFGPLDAEKIDKELKKINKSRGAKNNKSPQNTEVIDLRDKNETLQGENDGLQEKLETLLDDQKTLQGENETLQGENDGLQEKLETLLDDQKTLQGENETLRKELEGLKKSDIPDKSDKLEKKEKK